MSRRVSAWERSMATGGNPTLLPYLSDNLDFGAEWYYAPELLRVGRRLRERSDQLRRRRHGFTANQRRDSARRHAGDFQRHLAGQWPLGRGPRHRIGMAVHDWRYRLRLLSPTPPSSARTSRTTPTISRVSNFAVTGLANSWNFIPFYDKYGFQARVAINHRAEYLQNFGQTQNNSQFGIEPTFVNVGHVRGLQHQLRHQPGTSTSISRRST